MENEMLRIRIEDMKHFIQLAAKAGFIVPGFEESVTETEEAAENMPRGGACSDLVLAAGVEGSDRSGSLSQYFSAVVCCRAWLLPWRTRFERWRLSVDLAILD
jgi:hypothetical protein